MLLSAIQQYKSVKYIYTSPLMQDIQGKKNDCAFMPEFMIWLFKKSRHNRARILKPILMRQL